MPDRSSFRLVHFIALALVTCMGLTVAIMSAWTVWQLQYGFDEYLQAHDTERLDQFARRLEAMAQQSGGVSVVLQQPWPVVIDELAGSVNQDRPPDPHAPDQPARLDPPHPPPPHPPHEEGLDHRPPPPHRGPPDGFNRRLSLLDPQGQTLEGPPVRADDPSIRAAVQVQGQLQAYLSLRTVKALPDQMAQRFLQRQYLGLAGLALVMLLLTLGIAVLLARRWSRPLQAASHATARIAQGDWSSRIAEHHLTGWRTELDDLMHHINQMAQALQNQEHTRKRWLADISHELRTPLSVLQGEVEALLDGVRPLTLLAMGSLREEVLRLNALVNDLHLLSMADLQALPCHFESGDAVALLRNVQQRFAHSAQAQGIDLHVDLAEYTALPVRWDMHRMTQVLSNLVSNSLRYTDAPGRAVMRLRQEGGDVVIVMEDSAPGVSEFDLPRLLDPLFRVQADRARAPGDRHHGSGLGLSIAAAIVKAHRGQMTLASSTWGGLCVCVRLPAQPATTINTQ
jgi:two-component system sensor histidine kinase BaeS